jgi:hypothetical protein
MTFLFLSVWIGFIEPRMGLMDISGHGWAALAIALLGYVIFNFTVRW